MYQICNVAYLLVFRGRLKNVIHQYGNQLGYSMHTGSKCTVRGRAIDGLVLLLGLIYPSASHRVYDVEDTQFVSARGFLEVSKDLLDEDGF